MVNILIQSVRLSKYQFKGRMSGCTRHPTLVEGLESKIDNNKYQDKNKIGMGEIN